MDHSASPFPPLYVHALTGYAGVVAVMKDLLDNESIDNESLVKRSNRFLDGEVYHRLADVHGADVLLVGGAHDDATTVELFDLLCGAQAAGARRITAVLPYFGYSTMERAVKPGEVVKAKTRAVMLSAAPRPPMGTRFLLFDLHSEGIPYYFEGGADVRHVYGRDIVIDAFRQMGGEVLAAPDMGRAKWVESLATDARVPAATLMKRRKSATEVEFVGYAGADVAGKHVVIYDDMLRSGSTLAMAAGEYLRLGASKVSAFCTHAPLAGYASADVARQLTQLDQVWVTDSHPRAAMLGEYTGFRVVPCAPAFINFIT